MPSVRILKCTALQSDGFMQLQVLHESCRDTLSALIVNVLI